MQPRIRADRSFATQTVNLYDLRSAEPGLVIEPSFYLSWDEAQQLFDDLFRCGLRPSETQGSVGKLEAAEKHLAHVTRLLDQVLPLALRK